MRLFSKRLCNFIYNLHEDSVRILPFEYIGKIAVNKVTQNLKSLFRLVREKFKALDSDSIGKEPYWQRLTLSKLMNSVLLVDLSAHSFRMEACIQLLNPP